ncbi:MAG: class I SAM-dependent methyltransferase [Rhizobium sp.]
MSNGWPESAAAWIDGIGERGDFGREFVLDSPMMERISGRSFDVALDVGCGEGRFCRMLRQQGIRTVGIDPTEALIAQARHRDPEGDYRTGRAEDLQLPDGFFDLVVTYLSLIDIPDLPGAVSEMVRVLKPGGTLLIANLNSFSTAGLPQGWQRGEDGQARFEIDNYLEERAIWFTWRGVRIRNWHRPLSTYMGQLLQSGLVLKYFAEPAPSVANSPEAEEYRRVPYFHIMEWQKPAA